MKASTEEYLLFKDAVESFRYKVNDMSRIMSQDEQSCTVPSKVVGSLLCGLSSELFEILERDYSEE